MKTKEIGKRIYERTIRFCRNLPRGKKITALSVIGVMLVALCAGGWVLLGEEKNVTVTVDGETANYTTYTHTVADFLTSEHILVDNTAAISPSLESELEEGMEIVVNRETGVDILADGRTYYLSAFPITVAEALDKVGIMLDNDDMVTPGLDTDLTNGLVIEVGRIEVKTEEREIPLAYSVEKKPDSSLGEAVEKVVTKGVMGKETGTYKVTYNNGKIIKEELISSQRIEPISEVILVGSASAAAESEKAAAESEVIASTSGANTGSGASVDSTANPSQGPPDSSQYSEVLTVKATAYTHDGSKTKMGTQCRVGAIAVDPSVIPLGTSLYVEGYGYCTAEDTGGKIKGNRIDIFLNTEAECVDWGVRTVTVYVLK